MFGIMYWEKNTHTERWIHWQALLSSTSAFPAPLVQHKPRNGAIFALLVFLCRTSCTSSTGSRFKFTISQVVGVIADCKAPRQISASNYRRKSGWRNAKSSISIQSVHLRCHRCENCAHWRREVQEFVLWYLYVTFIMRGFSDFVYQLRSVEVWRNEFILHSFNTGLN